MRHTFVISLASIALLCVYSQAAAAAAASAPARPAETAPSTTKKRLSILRPSALKVLAYPSNIVSYARVGLLPYTAQAAALRDWRRFSTGYAALVAADVLNAAVAKSLRQESQLGRSLDLIVDSIGNLIMAHELSRMHPAHSAVIWSIALVGLASHWLQDKAAGDISHVKNMAHMPSLVRRFYSSALLFTYCVLGPRLLALGLVVLKHSQQYEPLVRTAITALGPSLILKTMIDVFALFGAVYSLAATHAAGIESKYATLEQEMGRRQMPGVAQPKFEPSSGNSHHSHHNKHIQEKQASQQQAKKQRPSQPQAQQRQKKR